MKHATVAETTSDLTKRTSKAVKTCDRQKTSRQNTKEETYLCLKLKRNANKRARLD